MDGNRAGKDPPAGQGPRPSTQANAAGLAGLDYTPQLSLHNQPTSQHANPIICSTTAKSLWFPVLACGFADFAQSRPGLRLAVNLGRARVLPCFVLLYSVIFV